MTVCLYNEEILSLLHRRQTSVAIEMKVHIRLWDNYSFQVTNVSSRSDKHLEVYENRYYGYLEDIIECDFNSFKIVLFEVKWYKLQMN